MRRVTIFLLAVIVACGLAVYLIVSTASAHGTEVRGPSDHYPRIPRCAADLWTRVTEGCEK